MQADHWGILADKVYQNGTESLQFIHFKKVYQKPPASANEEGTIRKISSHRAVEENVFGRMCSLWTHF